MHLNGRVHHKGAIPMNIDTINWTIPDFLLPSLFNGDNSGLTDDEVAALEDIEEQAQKIAAAAGADSWHWSAEPDDEAAFYQSHDARGIGACNCVTIQQVLMIKESSS
jgi:hypothetical protein